MLPRQSQAAPPDPLPPDRDMGPTLLGISSVLIALVLITTLLRLWVRFRLRTLGADDYLLVTVVFLGLARFIIQVEQGKLGNGRHRWYLADDAYERINMLGWVAQILLFASVSLLKISIMVFLLRIKDSRALKYTLLAIMLGLLVTNFGCIVILLAECQPVSAYWTGDGKCWDARVRIYAIYLTIAYSIMTDVLCSLLPLVVIWNVQLPFKTKLSVWALMSLGLVATGFGVARAASLGIVTNDLSWVYAITAIWSNLELYLGILGANFALGRSVYGFFFKEQVSSNPSGYELSNSNTAYLNSRYHGGDRTAFVRSQRAASPSRSDNSDLPLEPGIQKRTDIWVTEETESDLRKEQRSIG